MDDDLQTCDYDTFARKTDFSLAVGSLARYAQRQTDEWDEQHLLQMTGRRPALDSRGGNFVVVTDGMSVAEVRLLNSQSASCIEGSLVSLIGLHVAGDAFEAADLTVHADAGQTELPFIDTDAMKTVRPSSLPAIFSAHLAKRKAETDTLAATSPLVPTKSAAPPTRPSMPLIRNPFSQKMHIDSLSDLSSASPPDFVVGPVLIEDLAPGKKNSRTGKTGPCTFVVVDRAGNRVVYKTFGSFDSLVDLLGDINSQCFFLAGGTVTETKQEYVRRGCQPCEVMIDTQPGRSDAQKLMLRVAPDEWFVYMRGSHDSSSSSSSSAMDVDPMSVCDALDASVAGATDTSNAVVVGVVSSIEHRTARNGNKFWSIQLVDRRTASDPERTLKFTVFEDRALVNGWLLERVGDNGSYDRLVSTTGQPMVVRLSGLHINAGVQFPFEVDRGARIEEVHNFAQDRINLVQVASLSTLSPSTLAGLLNGPCNIPCNVLVAVAHVTEERQGTARGTGRKYAHRSISVIDSSREVDGRHPLQAIKLFPPHPLIDAVIEHGEAREPAFAALQGKQREYEITDPSRVVIAHLMGVYMEPSREEGRRGYIGSKNVRMVVVTPSDGNDAAEALRTWYQQKGHLSFVPCARLEREFMDADEVQSSSSSSSSSSAHSSIEPVIKYDAAALRAAGEGDW